MIIEINYIIKYVIYYRQVRDMVCERVKLNAYSSIGYRHNYEKQRPISIHFYIDSR